jgi:hypothetical protein
MGNVGIAPAGCDFDVRVCEVLLLMKESRCASAGSRAFCDALDARLKTLSFQKQDGKSRSRGMTDKRPINSKNKATALQ